MREYYKKKTIYIPHKRTIHTNGIINEVFFYNIAQEFISKNSPLYLINPPWKNFKQTKFQRNHENSMEKYTGKKISGLFPINIK